MATSKPAFKIWYAIYVGSLHSIFTMRRSKKAAKAIVRDARKTFPELTFGIKRLLEKVEPKRRRRRRRKAKPIPALPPGFTVRTKQ